MHLKVFYFVFLSIVFDVFGAGERKCMKHWTNFDKYCYLKSSVLKTFHEAYLTCSNYGASVVVLQQNKSFEFILKFDFTDNTTIMFWTIGKGSTDSKAWYSNSADSKAWYSTEQTCQAASGMIQNSSTTFALISQPCDEKLHVICEQNLYECQGAECEVKRKRSIDKHFDYNNWLWNRISQYPYHEKSTSTLHPLQIDSLPTTYSQVRKIENQSKIFRLLHSLKNAEDASYTRSSEITTTIDLTTIKLDSTTKSSELSDANSAFLSTSTIKMLTDASTDEVTPMTTTSTPILYDLTTLSKFTTSPAMKIGKKEKYQVTCQNDDYIFGESCYRLEIQQNRQWQAANDRCKEINNGYLAVINDRFEHEALRNYINISSEGEREFWIGLYVDSYFKDKLTNETSEKAINYSHWFNGQPMTFPNWWKISADVSRGNCGYYQLEMTESALWPLKSCEEELPYICEYQSTVLHIHVETECFNEEWLYYKGSCYKFHGEEAQTWSQAEDTCIAFGGHLVSFASENEQEYIRINLKLDGPFSRFWIGYFLDQNGQRVFTEDNDYYYYMQLDSEVKVQENTNQYCGAAHYHTFSTSNHTCDAYLPFICERKAGPLRNDLNRLSIPKQEPDEYCFDDESKSWLKFGDNCYKIVPRKFGHFSKTQSGWDFNHARLQCFKENALPVYIESHEENYFLASKIWKLDAENVGLWIGAIFDPQKEKFYWNRQSDKEITYSNWYFGEPNNIFSMEHCVIIYTHVSAYWNDDHCSKNYGYICKKPEVGILLNKSFDNQEMFGSCPSDWNKMGKKCIKINFYNKLEVVDALKECEKNHEFGNLVSIHSAKEQAFLNTLLASHKQPVWIGLRKLYSDSVNEFGWYDQSPMGNFSNWGPGEPTSIYHFMNIYKDSDCVIMASTGQFGKWREENCYAENGFICQMPLVITSAPELNATLLPVNATCSAPYSSFYYFEGDCYHEVETPLNWQDAEIVCKEMGAHLVSILNSKELSFVWSQFGMIMKKSLWIGLKKITSAVADYNDRFMWSDQWPEIFDNWALTQEPEHEQDCVAMSLNDGFWRKAKCTERRSFVCKHTKVSYFPPIQHRVAGHCKKGWWDFGSEHCYFLEDYAELKTWRTAMEICHLLDAQMVSIHTQHDMRIMEKIAESSKGNIWLGLKRDGNRFRWTDQTPFNYANWMPHEPNNIEEECAEMMAGTGLWNDKPCSFLARVMCKANKMTFSVGSQRLEQNEPSKKNIMNPGAIVGINLGIILLLGLFGGAAFTYYRRRKSRPGHIYGFDNVTYNSKPPNVVLGEDSTIHINREIDCIMCEENEDDDE